MPRDTEVIRLLAEGEGNKEIAAPWDTVRTVGTNRARIILKLGLHSLTSLVHYAIRNEIAFS